jgi:K+-transporting ATPase ATPase A chain
MVVSDVVQPLLLLALLVVLTPPLGAYVARAMAGERTPISPAIRPLERLAYRGLRLVPGRG